MLRTKFAAAAAMLAFAATASATPIVKQYNTVTWSTGVDVSNTVQAVGGLTYAGHISGASDLDGTDIVVAGQWNAMFKDWVAAGGVFIQHDWFSGAYYLPGLSNVAAGGVNGADLNVIDAGSAIVNGPLGTITNTLLDNGSASVHNAWTLASLIPDDLLAGSVHPILSSTDPNSVAVFEYSYGAGHIIYAGIPLEAYTDSDPLTTGAQPAGLRVYAGNELAYAASLLDQPANVPEPASLALIGLGLAGIAARKRKQA